MLDAYALFLQARSAVTAARYPDRLAYTIVVSGVDGSRPKTNHYRAEIAMGDVIRVFPMSDEEMAAPPPVPHGFNFGLTAEFCMQRCETGTAHYRQPVGPAPSAFDLLGLPAISPAYAFGLAYPATSVRAARGSGDAGAIPIIAVVATKQRDYSVTLVDTPVIDGVATYHLKLVPLRKPKDNRLRELWIGHDDYLPRKAIVSGNFTLAPLVDVPWTIDFAVTDRVPYVEMESAQAALYMPHRRVVRDARIAFENLHEPTGVVGRPLVDTDPEQMTLVEPPVKRMR